MVGGLATDEIARAFLVPSATMGQRISRAKRTLTEAEVPFAIPDADELPGRLSAVLEVVYLIFNERYAATSGDEWMRRDLAEQAMRLGRMLVGLMPFEPEVHGLVALMALQASRFPARTRPGGRPVLLPDQDRSRWDRTLIAHEMSALARARGLRKPLGPYTVQAAIAACHARARRFGDTDGEAVLALYDALSQLTPSPVVQLNRAVAVLHVDGPQAALAAVDALRGDPRMARYHLLGAVRATCWCGWASTPRPPRNSKGGRAGAHPTRADDADGACGCRHSRLMINASVPKRHCDAPVQRQPG
jgi:predicted RNA polymerase sigma factor